MDERKRRRAHWLRDFLCGALIGAGAILPGVSGGVLAVVFGIYRPFMEVLTRPRKAVPRYWRMLIPLGLGWAAGFLGVAKGVAAAMTLSDAVTYWLFIGLIAGTAPSLFREAGKEGRSASAWGSFSSARRRCSRGFSTSAGWSTSRWSRISGGTTSAAPCGAWGWSSPA